MMRPPQHLLINRHIDAPLFSVFFVFLGIVCILLFNEGVFIAISASASILLLSVFSVLVLYRKSRIGILTTLLFVVYLLPFIHIFPYLWFDFESESPLFLWGTATNPYMTDKNIIELMSMIGAVGIAGFVAGASLLPGKIPICRSRKLFVGIQIFKDSLPIHVFVIWIVLAIVFTWISAPADTVFTAAYTESISIYESWNFSSAMMFSYAFLLFALGDLIFETSTKVRIIKRNIVLCSFIIIVVWFQLLRGDRESLTCVLAAVFMYFVWGKEFRDLRYDSENRNYLMVILLFLLVYFAAFIAGIVRPLLVGVESVDDFMNVLNNLFESGAFRIDNLISGTWSGVLLTPLSIAGDYINGSLPIREGRTYIDLLLSVIPGFMADLIGFIRPIDAMHGPAWEMTYGQGGTHAVVVPFMNFRMTGVFLIVGIWSFIITNAERYLSKKMTVIRLSLLGIIAMAIPHWFWYGEKNIINAIIIWFVLYVVYGFFISARRAVYYFFYGIPYCTR